MNGPDVWSGDRDETAADCHTGGRTSADEAPVVVTRTDPEKRAHVKIKPRVFYGRDRADESGEVKATEIGLLQRQDIVNRFSQLVRTTFSHTEEMTSHQREQIGAADLGMQGEAHRDEGLRHLIDSRGESMPVVAIVLEAEDLRHAP